jgi:O-antigen ligase
VIGALVAGGFFELLWASTIIFMGVLALIRLEWRHRGSLILVLVLGYIVKGRDFAYLPTKILPLSISSSEIALSISLLVALWVAFHHRDSLSRIWIPGIPVLAILGVVWTIAFFRGLTASLEWSLRNSILFFYCLFYLLVPHLLNSQYAFERALKWVLVAGGVSALLLLLPESIISIVPLLAPGGNAHLFLGTSFILTISLIAARVRYWRLLVLLAGFLLFEILLVQVRGMWVGLTITLGFSLALIFQSNFLRKNIMAILRTGFIASMLILISLGLFNPQLMTEVVNEAASTVYFRTMEGSSAAQAIQRLDLWRDVFDEVFKHSLLGIGLGTPFYYSSVDEALVFGEASGLGHLGYNAPHNSYVFLVLRMGVLGFGAYLLFFGYLIWQSSKAIRRMNNQRLRLYALISLLSMVYLLATALTLPIFEGPYIGSVLWIFAGATIAAINIDRGNVRSPQVKWNSQYSRVTGR